ncbi:MAG: cytochrome c [Polyangiaceae bacterium]|nr:cytochrome c [Polyangiaceae bacterium]MCL4750323.1 hypothetical protein [Myxococcales bacterium]
MSWRAGLFALLLPVGACVHVDELDDYACPDGGTSLDYASFGEPFLERWCNSCHSAGEGDRQGAPADVRFDSVEEVRRWRERIFARSALGNDSMPPGLGDPPTAERRRLAEWLACGAP